MAFLGKASKLQRSRWVSEAMVWSFRTNNADSYVLYSKFFWEPYSKLPVYCKQVRLSVTDADL